MSNPYIAAQRGKFDALNANVRSITDKAATEKRDLSDDELRSVTEQNEAARKLADEITALTEAQERSTKVGALAAEVDANTGAEETRGSRFTTQDRDPGHYRKEGGHSFFADGYQASKGNRNAAERLQAHTRALSTSAGSGLIQPRWMTDEFETLKRQGRAIANAVRNLPLGQDPRAINFGKQTAGTDSVVGVQANENDAPTATNAITTGTDVMTPVTITGEQDYSRQFLDSSDPSIDAVIFGDLVSVYNYQIEALVGSKLKTAAGVSATLANEAAFVTGALDAVVDASVAVRVARHANAELIVMTPQRYGAFLKLKDADGRPLIGGDSGVAMNVFGVGEVAVEGRIRGLGVIQTEGVGTGSYPDKFLILKPQDTLLFESGLTEFTYDQVAGPHTIKVGIWGYAGCIVREGGRGVKAVQVTAAS